MSRGLSSGAAPAASQYVDGARSDSWRCAHDDGFLGGAAVVDAHPGYPSAEKWNVF